MDMYLIDTLYAYLPQLFGSLLVANALYFFGQNDKMDKNNLTFSASGFLLLTLHCLFCVLTSVLVQYGVIISPQTSGLVNSVFISCASLLFIVGGFEYARILVWVHKIITVPVFLMCLFFMILFAKEPTMFEEKDVLFNAYTSAGLLILSGFLCLTRFTSKAYNLRLSGVLILVLSVYYGLKVFDVNCHSWITETLLYVILIWSIYWTTLQQMRKQIRAVSDELKATKAKIPLIIQSSPFPVIVSALKDDRVMLANEQACTLFNIDKKSLKDFKTEQYYVDANVHHELIQKLSVSPTVENFQALLHKPNSEANFWLEIYARIIDYDNEVALYAAFKDITEQKKQEHDLFAKAVLDPLTGCYKRRQFQELATQEIASASRYNTPFCMIMMDIDHFKNVNDTYGHAFGDAVLKTLARVCKATIRESDIFARYGGEEFVCMLTQTDITGGIGVAERLRSNIEKTIIKQPSGQPFSFTVSLGIAGSDATQNLNDLIKCADSALYQAKENGRNQVRVYEDPLALSRSVQPTE